MQTACDTDELTVEDVAIRGPNYCLRGELAYRENGSALGAVVLAGPHPLLGGNMHNNVVRGLGDGLARRGFLTLRFDYRGVGRSEGPRRDVAKQLAEFWRTSHVAGETDYWRDLQAATDFMRASAPGLPLALVGYSFGCALLPTVRPRDDVVALVLVAPTVAQHDYDHFLAINRPLLVIASEDDFATTADQLQHWLDTLAMPRQLVRTRLDNHFFRGHEDWLAATVFQYLSRPWRQNA